MDLDLQTRSEEQLTSMMDLNLSPPIFLSPSSESQHSPFFSTFDGAPQSLEFELNGDERDHFKDHRDRRTPSLILEDDDDDGLASMIGTPASKQLGQSRFSSASISSTASSAAPSEADSEDFRAQDRDGGLLPFESAFDLDNDLCSLSVDSKAFGVHVPVPYSDCDTIKKSKMNQSMFSEYLGLEGLASEMQYQTSQEGDHVSHANLALNTFNLSDFISVHDNDQLSSQKQSLDGTFRQQDSQNIKPTGSLQRSLSFSLGQQSVESHAGFSDRMPTFGTTLNQRPNELLRSHTAHADMLSCNPALVTPGQQKVYMSDAFQATATHFRLHSEEESNREILTQKAFTSSPSVSSLGFWEDSHDVSSSPVSFLRKVSGTRAANEMHFGAVRAGRPTITAASHTSSPYTSPSLSEASSGGNIQQAAFTEQTLGTIITKRSRGRRVPNNPEELNNLGKSGKVYTCEVPGCGKCFKRSEHLKRHVRSIHTDDKPFTCHCGKTFSRHDNLNQHARVHAQAGSMSSMSPQSEIVSPAIPALSLGKNSGHPRSHQAQYDDDKVVDGAESPANGIEV